MQKKETLREQIIIFARFSGLSVHVGQDVESQCAQGGPDLVPHPGRLGAGQQEPVLPAVIRQLHRVGELSRGPAMARKQSRQQCSALNTQTGV